MILALPRWSTATTLAGRPMRTAAKTSRSSTAHGPLAITPLVSSHGRCLPPTMTTDPLTPVRPMLSGPWAGHRPPTPHSTTSGTVAQPSIFLAGQARRRPPCLRHRRSQPRRRRRHRRRRHNSGGAPRPGVMKLKPTVKVATVLADPTGRTGCATLGRGAMPLPSTASASARAPRMSCDHLPRLPRCRRRHQLPRPTRPPQQRRRR